MPPHGGQAHPIDRSPIGSKTRSDRLLSLSRLANVSKSGVKMSQGLIAAVLAAILASTFGQHPDVVKCKCSVMIWSVNLKSSIIRSSLQKVQTANI